MKIQVRHFSARLLKLFQSWSRNNPGIALVISLLVMLALSLLGLTLLLLSNTESMISLNERDSTLALYNAEGALAIAKELIIANAAISGDLTYLLNGADNDPATDYDNGVMKIRSVDPTITRFDLDNNCAAGSTTCETYASAIEELDDDGDGVRETPYEVFHVGINRDNDPDGTWDGPRGLVWVRVDDNHDDEPYPDDPRDDNDKRVTITIVSEYPILVDDNGKEIDDAGQKKTLTREMVGISKRKLKVRFGPSTVQPALLTDGNMTIGGALDVCGNCGGVHANGTVTINPDDVDICRDATSTATKPVRSDGGTLQIGGIVDQVEKLDIAIGNPFHEDYVPKKAWFNTTEDRELRRTDLLRCHKIDPVRNPGGTKYFAFVADGANGRIYKAYWQTSDRPPRWNWELIDILRDGFNPILDDCGRLRDDGAGGAIHAPDPIDPIPPSPTDLTGPVDDGRDDEFYGFKIIGPPPGGVTCNASDDKTLSGVQNNDYGIVTRVPPIPGITYMLPGTSGPARVENDLDHKDGIADFIPANAMASNENKWMITGPNVYSPLYNAVIFVYGNLDLNAAPAKLCTSADPGPACTTQLPGKMWRATWIAFNNITTGGSPRYGPFRPYEELPDFQYLFVAGRDIELSERPVPGTICPGNCSADSPRTAGYNGMIIAHEQIRLINDATVNGLVVSEDAANCSSYVQGVGLEAVVGSSQVYYNCSSPPSDFERSGIVKSWEEIQ